MVPSLHWLLLLWGLQGLLAQEYEDDYEEEEVTPKRKNKLFSSNSIPQNGKCEGKYLLPQVKNKRNMILNKDTAGGCNPLGLIVSQKPL